jgi:hypothetical protein
VNGAGVGVGVGVGCTVFVLVLHGSWFRLKKLKSVASEKKRLFSILLNGFNLVAESRIIELTKQ